MTRMLKVSTIFAFVALLAACGGLESLFGPVSPPDTPTNFGIVKLTASGFTLSWIDNAGNEQGFKIERKVGPQSVWQQIASVGANTQIYEDGGLSGAELHLYRVRAYNREGNSDYTSEASALLPASGELEPTVTILSPQTGSTVGSPVQVTFDIQDWDMEAADGKPTHFHPVVDDVDQGALYSTDPWEVSLSPGVHVITLRLANAQHKFIGVDDTVEITVR